MYEFVLFFAIASEDEDELGVFLEGEGGGVHEISEAFLNGKATDGGNNVVTATFKLCKVIVGILIELVFGSFVGVVEGVVNDADFV